MLAHVRAHLLLIVLSIVGCSVLYPLTVLAIGQGLFRHQANGQILTGPDGQPIGSALIAQEFTGDEWFQSRPSAVGYNAAGSGGSNYGANKPELRSRVEETLKSRTEASVPADAVTTSGSGLDPHITRRNADGQLDRVAAAWATKSGRTPAEVRTTVEGVLNDATFRPLAGLVDGEPLVSVLEVNLELSRRLAR